MKATSDSTLDQVAPGRRVHVRAVQGDPQIARRLDDLGVREGVEIEVLRRAPLGDPTVFELHGYQLCLRQAETACIAVTAADEAPVA